MGGHVIAVRKVGEAREENKNYERNEDVNRRKASMPLVSILRIDIRL